MGVTFVTNNGKNYGKMKFTVIFGAWRQSVHFLSDDKKIDESKTTDILHLVIFFYQMIFNKPVIIFSLHLVFFHLKASIQVDL